jgi:SAM-dependent methyltransferase
MAPAPARVRGVALACPRDQAALVAEADALRCARCQARYPIVRGVPVLIDDANSVFAVGDYVGNAAYQGAAYGRAADPAGGARRAWRRLARWLGDAPSSIRHPGAAEAIAYVAARRPGARVLVIGAGGLDLASPGAVVVHSDVAFGPAVDLIADAHGLPFPAASFDLVVAVAVLEHVADPQRCVAEIARVLTPGGHVFAVTPFLQPVHMGAHDFTRFTPIGHRRLFRAFDEVAAGVAMGVGSVAAWTFGAVLQSASAWRPWRMAARMLGLVATPPLRLLDSVLRHGADAAGGCWFLGVLRAGPPIPDRALVESYRAGFGHGPRHLPPP